jgi:hypothetical protein
LTSSEFATPQFEVGMPPSETLSGLAISPAASVSMTVSLASAPLPPLPPLPASRSALEPPLQAPSKADEQETETTNSKRKADDMMNLSEGLDDIPGVSCRWIARKAISLWGHPAVDTGKLPVLAVAIRIR